MLDLLFSEQQLLTFKRIDCWVSLLQIRAPIIFDGKFCLQPKKKAKSETCHNTLINTKLTSVSIDYKDMYLRRKQATPFLAMSSPKAIFSTLRVKPDDSYV